MILSFFFCKWGEDDDIYPMGFLWRLNELNNLKHLEPPLEYSKYYLSFLNMKKKSSFKVNTVC